MTPGITEITITTTMLLSRHRREIVLMEVLPRGPNIQSPTPRAAQGRHPPPSSPPPRVRPQGQCPPFRLHRALPLEVGGGEDKQHFIRLMTTGMSGHVLLVFR